MAKKKQLGDEVALYLFHQGNNMKAYEYMGAHKVEGKRICSPSVSGPPTPKI